MSQANTATSDEAIQLETVEGLSAVVKSQKKLVLISLGLGTTALLCAIAFLVLGGTSHTEAEPTIDPNSAHIESLEVGLADVLLQIQEQASEATQSRTDLSQLSTQVGRLDVNDERNAFIRLQRLTIKQEQDFQAFLGTLEAGLYNFHMMVPHSRGWWEEYKADLDAAQQLSKAREEYATTLRDN